MPSDWLLIGIGNEYRSDDGIGLLIAREMRKKQFPFLTIKEASGEGTSLMEAWQGFQHVILVDAVSSGGTPGTIHRFDAGKEKIPAKFFHYSTHAFSVAEAVELARALTALPESLLLYGIEGENYSAGTIVSMSVQEAIQKAIAQIVNDIQRH